MYSPGLTGASVCSHSFTVLLLAGKNIIAIKPEGETRDAGVDEFAH